MAAMALSRFFRAATFLFGVAALAVGCGDGSRPSSTATHSLAAAPTATPGPTRTIPETIFDAPAPVGISTLTFIDPQHGWAIDTCPENKDISWCTIMATSDGGVTWHRQYRSTHRIGTLQFLDARYGFAIGNDNTIVSTTDGGASWTEVYASAPSGMGGIRFVTPQVGFATASGVIFQTTDRGRTWLFDFGVADCGFGSLDFVSSQHGWAGGHGTEGPCLYETTDSGGTWGLSFKGAASAPVKEAFQDFLHRTGNSSLSELLGHVNGECLGTSTRFFSETDGWLLISCQSYFSGGFAIMRTKDGGDDWHYVWGPTGCIMGCQMATGGQFPVFFLSTDHVWRQGRDNIELSENGGETWKGGQGLLGDQCCYGFHGVFFVDAKHGWLPSRGDDPPNTIRRTNDGGLTWSILPVTIH